MWLNAAALRSNLPSGRSWVSLERFIADANNENVAHLDDRQAVFACDSKQVRLWTFNREGFVPADCPTRIDFGASAACRGSCIGFGGQPVRLLRYEPPVPNFGDDLNAVLWPALAPSLFAREGRPADRADAFVGIGTIIGLDPGCSLRLHVFSSGVGYTSAERWSGLDVQYHCVRGPLTARALGLSPNASLTDGAVLAPLVETLQFPIRDGSAAGTVVVPHYETIASPGWAEATSMAGFDLVDPRGTPHQVIEKLANARMVLTESLHGAIVADAYGVPWRGFAVSRNFSTAKWADWAGSLNLSIEVGIVPPPDPLPLLRFGKRDEPFGAMVRLDPETAFREFQSRIAHVVRPSSLKARIKRLFEEVPLARRVLGFHPERTAAALTKLAACESYLSGDGKRGELRDRMLSRLDVLIRRERQGMVDTD